MIRAVIFDLDGVLYCGDKVIDGAVEAVLALRDAGLRIFYITNNSAKMRWQVITKLHVLGFPAAPKNTYCASHAVFEYLTEQKLSPVYLIGTNDMRKELLVCGDVEVKDSSDVTAVIVALDPDFNYQKITIALAAIGKGAKLIAANLDPWYPAENGKKFPGCGAMVGAIIGATGHQPDFVVGKPNSYMLEILCKEHSLSPPEICVVGDVLESDIAMANNFGCTGILFDPGNAFPSFSNRIGKLEELSSALTRLEAKYERA